MKKVGKKLSYTLVLAAIMGTILYANNLNIGTLNTQTVLQSYSGSATIQQELEQKKSDLQSVLTTEQNQLTAQKNALDALGSKATAEQTSAYQTALAQYQTDYQQMQQELNQYQSSQMQQLKTTIMAAAQGVALQNNYNLVLDSQAVWYGGNDISSQVATVLNGMTQINLDN